MRLSRHPADYQPPLDSTHAKPADQRSTVTLQFRKTGKPRLTQDTAMNVDQQITARRKSTNGVRWKNLLRRYRVRRLPEIRFLELAKGFEPLTL
jgi:hypothetical protein